MSGAVKSEAAADKRWPSLVFGSAVVALLAWGWLERAAWPHVAEEGVGYWLGIVGGILLLYQTVYPLRKRVAALKNLGSTRLWFMSHMLAGVIAPVALLFHCNFQLGSMNGRVALFCMLLVAVSGLVGRYLYTRIHHGLYGRRKRLEQLQERWEKLQQRLMGAAQGNERLEAYLSGYERRVRASVYHPIRAVLGLVLLRLRSGWVAWRAYRLLKQIEGVDDKALSLMSGLLRQRVQAARAVAEFNGYERLFALWHVVHLPFFFLMLIAGVFHVVAVHMY